MDGPGLAVVGLVALEWLGLGWLSGICWPGGDQAYASWGVRLLVGLSLTSVAMLLLALVGVGFASPVVVLVVAGLGALGLRALQGQALAVQRTVPGAREASARSEREVPGEREASARAEREVPGERDAWACAERDPPGAQDAWASAEPEAPGARDVPGERRGCGQAHAAQAQVAQCCEGTKRGESAVDKQIANRPAAGERVANRPAGEGVVDRRAGERVADRREHVDWLLPAREHVGGVLLARKHLGRLLLAREHLGWLLLARGHLGWVLLAVVLLAACLRSFSVPEAGWDAYSHWGLKALAYTHAGTIVDTHTVHEYYPPLVPLAETFLYLERGSASIDLGKDVWALVGSALILCVVAHLRRLLRQPWLAAYVGLGVLLASTQLLEDFSTGQADLALTAFLTLATLAVLAWLRNGQRGWLIQIGVFAAAAALTKFEGVPRIGVLAACVGLEALLLRRPSAWWAAGWLVFGAVAGTAVWLGFELSHGIAPTGEHIGALQPWAMLDVLRELAAVFGGVRTGGAIAVVVLAWLVAARRTFHGPNRLLATTVIAQAAATLVAFLVSDTAPDVEVRTAATRLVEQFMPIALVASAVWLEAELIIRPGR